ncbi:MAG TPA: hypothetical protein VE732_01850, partial [Nitrososphaera sp.]|nr:hypothetical protein [Nitrososphaera sp.]
MYRVQTKIIPRLNSCPSVSVLGPVTIYFFYYFSLTTTLFILIENKEKEKGGFIGPQLKVTQGDQLVVIVWLHIAFSAEFTYAYVPPPSVP